MQGDTAKSHLVKQVKPLLIAIPLNLLAGLMYCFITKKMSIVSYSNVLMIIGGVYAAIGGMSFMSGMDLENRNSMMWSREANQKSTYCSSRINSNISILIIGIITVLISYVIGKFR